MFSKQNFLDYNWEPDSRKNNFLYLSFVWRVDFMFKNYLDIFSVEYFSLYWRNSGF